MWHLQMQLSDRQSSHAQASSTAMRHASSEPVGFRKACSPDIPEPPHKKGSGQGSSLESAQKQPAHQLRRKLPENLGRRSPSASPRPHNVEESKDIGQNASALNEANYEEKQMSKSLPQLSPIRKPDFRTNGGKMPSATSMFAMNDTSKRLSSSSTGDHESRDKELARQLKLARLLGNRGNTGAAQAIAEELYANHYSNPDVLCLRGQCFAAGKSRAQVCMPCSSSLFQGNVSLKHLVLQSGSAASMM